MFRLLANLLTLKLVDRVSVEAERRLQELQGTVKRTAFGLFVLKMGSSLLMMAAGLFLAGLFLHISELPRFVMPAIWTGLAALGGALVTAILAGLLMRR